MAIIGIVRPNMRHPRHEPVVAPEFGDAFLGESENDFVARDRAQSEKHLSTDVSAFSAATPPACADHSD